MAWLIYFHLLAVLGLMLAHGTSVAVAFRIRKETEPARIKAYLELSFFWVGLIHLSMFLVIGTGIALGFVGNRWDEAWLWTSIGVLVLLWVLMSLLGTRYYDRVRRGVGAASFYGGEKAKALPPVSAQELEALLRSSRPIVLSVIGLAGFGIILWLMMFKPF